MRKHYSAPVIEKVVFDYRVQTQANSGPCVESVVNIRTATDICGEGTRIVVGWTLPQTAVTG